VGKIKQIITVQNSDLSSAYQFTNDWFGMVKNVWDQLIPQVNPSKILEIGSYEGASTCYLIDSLASKKNIEIHCVDNWEGGIEHRPGGSAEADMSEVEKRFLYNTNLSISRNENRVDLQLHKGCSDVELSRLLAGGKQNYFDFIYVDGSHQAPDVLCDAVLSFRLLREGGVMAFDDYLWSENLSYGLDPIRCPKPAIDVFTNIYCRKLRIISAPLYQLYIEKTAN
jgi:predicted O-methyltransferase YrrM